MNNSIADPSTGAIVAPQSRNAPCPCGSGKRYKDCHGALPAVTDGGAVAPDATTADEVWREAQAALAQGRPELAVASVERALAQQPQRPDLSLVRARIALALNDNSTVAALCRELLARSSDPSSADLSIFVAADNLLGEALRSSDLVAAEAAWRHALHLDPDDAEANFHLGNLDRERGEPEKAVAFYNKALVRAPAHAGLLNNLGLALEATGQFDQAEGAYRQALAVESLHPDALANLGNVLYERERYSESARTYERAFTLRQTFPTPIWVRRAIAQVHARDFVGAAASFAEAARLDPDDLQIQISLLTQQMNLGLYAEAEPALLRTLELDPGNPYALSMLVHSRQHRCIWRGMDSLFDQINHALDNEPRADERYAVNPFPLLGVPSTPRAQLRASQRWAASLRAPVATAPRARVPQGKRLRIGFVSADFREHPMAYLSMEYWERIDRDRFDVYAYGLQPTDTGPIGQRISNAFEHFHDVSQLPSSEIAQRVRGDNIAILLDLNGYTAHGDNRLFAMRPAPVQVNVIGFPGTLGIDWYDYIMVDPFGAPEAMQAFYTERLWQLPNSSYPSDTTRTPSGPPPSRAQCGLPEDAFVFCCFNKSFKILPDMFTLWMRLLAAVPDSVLWLLGSSDEAVGNLQREASNAGIDPARLLFAPKVPQGQHLARHAAADIFLDSYPYGAHTTTNDALLAGLPVITLAGETLVTRLAGSQLHAVGLPDLVTTSFADYEALALRLARNRASLALIRARLAANRQTYPLFDMARYTRDFEDGLTQLWRSYNETMSSA